MQTDVELQTVWWLHIQIVFTKYMLDIVRYILLCVTLTVTVFIAQLSHLKLSP